MLDLEFLCPKTMDKIQLASSFMHHSSRFALIVFVSRLFLALSLQGQTFN